MKRLLLLLACLLALCTTVVAAEPAISDMKTDCTLTGSGACQVTQTFTMEIDGAQTQLRFPLVPGAKKASVAGYDAQKQTDGDCPVLVLSDASGFTGTRSFTVLYTVSGLVSEADGVQTLQLPLLSAKWAYPISRYQFTVTMPKPFEGYPAFVSGYYSDVISDYIDLDVSESLISGTIATGLKDHESLDMTLTLDKSYFSGAYTALSFSWVGMAVIVALLALAFGYWFVTLRSAPIRTSTRRLPPDAVLPCDMPFLVGGGPIQFNMLVCHWASLGYLTIFCGKNGRVALRRRVDMGNERRPAEVRLFQMLFSQGDVCEGASLLYKRTAEKADAVLRRYWVRKLYRKSSGNPLLARAFGLLAVAVEVRNDVVEREQKDHAGPKACRSRNKRPTSHAARLLDCRDQQAPNGCRDHDASGEAGQCTLDAFTERFSHEEHTRRAQRCAKKWNQNSPEGLHRLSPTLISFC